MTDVQQDFIRGALAQLIHAFVVSQKPGLSGADTQAKIQADNDAMAGIQTIASQTLIDLNRCADALERLATAQEGRLEVERAKLGHMAKALAPEQKKAPGIIRGIP